MKFPQTVTLRGIFIIPAPGVWVVRLARLAAAKWARLNGVRIIHTNVVPAALVGVPGYQVRVTIPAGEYVANFRHPPSPVPSSPTIALA